MNYEAQLLTDRVINGLPEEWETARAIAARLGGVSIQRVNETLYRLGTNTVEYRCVNYGKGDALRLRTEWRKKAS